MVAIVVPSLGESVTEATIAKWFKKPGEAVKKDEPLVELETDKVTMEVNAPESGVLASVTAPEGTTVNIGAVLGDIDPKGTPSVTAAAPAAAAPAPVAAPASNQQPATSNSPQNPPSVTKLLAENPQVNAGNVAATGKDGRLTKGDVLGALSGASPAAAAAPAAAPKELGPREERVKMTKLRAAIARRLKESQNTAAILTTFNDIDMTNCMALRAEYKDHVEKKYGIRLGFMGFFVKAAVQALKEIPEVNGQIDGDTIIYKNHYDIGVAVGTEQCAMPTSSP